MKSQGVLCMNTFSYFNNAGAEKCDNTCISEAIQTIYRSNPTP